MRIYGRFSDARDRALHFIFDIPLMSLSNPYPHPAIAHADLSHPFPFAPRSKSAFPNPKSNHHLNQRFPIQLPYLSTFPQSETPTFCRFLSPHMSTTEMLLISLFELGRLNDKSEDLITEG
jgi:hypothetical protein